MQYKDENGVIHEFTLIKGESAYQSAKAGGYKGTEEEFYKLLGDIPKLSDIDTLKTEVNESVSELSKGIENLASQTSIPNFSADNEEMVLGIKDGKLAWIEASVGGATTLIKSFTVTPNTLSYEKGQTIPSIKFAWELLKTPTEQTFNNEIIDATDREKTITNVNATKTYKLNAKTSSADETKTLTISFVSKKYYGVSSANTYDNDFLLGLNGVLSADGKGNFNVNAGAGQYIFFAVPTSYGDKTFTVGGFSGGFTKVDTISHTNASGYTCDYDIYKSDNDNLGSTTVVVS